LIDYPMPFADYLDDPGPHHRQASALARKMLDDNGANLPAAVRGNTFAVALRFDCFRAGQAHRRPAIRRHATRHLRVGNNLPRRRDNPLTKALP